jgi:HPt (histidine-containing phosphotransfer) domain-containing protein
MENNGNDPVRKIAEMRENFGANLDNRLKEFEGALDNVSPKVDPRECRASIEKLHGLSHKLRGAAGTFGHPKLSAAAANMENFCKELISSGSNLTLGARV